MTAEDLRRTAEHNFLPATDAQLTRWLEAWREVEQDAGQIRALQMLFSPDLSEIVHGTLWWEERPRGRAPSELDELNLFLSTRTGLDAIPKPYCPDAFCATWVTDDGASISLSPQGTYGESDEDGKWRVHRSLFDELWTQPESTELPSRRREAHVNGEVLELRLLSGTTFRRFKRSSR